MGNYFSKTVDSCLRDPNVMRKKHDHDPVLLCNPHLLLLIASSQDASC